MSAVVEVTLEREAFNAETFAEMLPLIQKCWDECSIVKSKTCAYHGDRNFAIEPNFEAYMELASKGAIVLLMLRDEGELKGYVIGFSYRSLHHKKVLCGIGDSLYIEPEYRAHIRGMIAKFEDELRNMGVEIIGWPTTLGSHLYELLKARDYIGDDVVMEKRLCVSLPR